MRDRKFLGWLIAALCALFLAALGPTLYVSFEQSAWIIGWYPLAEPLSAPAWMVIAIAIMVAMVVSPEFYHNSCHKLIGFFTAWAIGATMIGTGTTVAWLVFFGIISIQSTLPFFAMVLLISLFATMNWCMLAQLFDLTKRPDPGSGTAEQGTVLKKPITLGENPEKRRWGIFTHTSAALAFN